MAIKFNQKASGRTRANEQWNSASTKFNKHEERDEYTQLYANIVALARVIYRGDNFCVAINQIDVGVEILFEACVCFSVAGDMFMGDKLEPRVVRKWGYTTRDRLEAMRELKALLEDKINQMKRVEWKEEWKKGKEMKEVEVRDATVV